MGAVNWWRKAEAIDEAHIYLSKLFRVDNPVGATSLARKFAPGDCQVYHFTRQIKITLDDHSVWVSIYDKHNIPMFTSLLDDVLNTILKHSTRAPFSGMMILYDTTRCRSWIDCKVLIEGLEDRAQELDTPTGFRERVMIVGCKCDLVQEREVDYVTVKQYADKRGLLFMETSAKENINVEFVFLSFVAQIMST